MHLDIDPRWLVTSLMISIDLAK